MMRSAPAGSCGRIESSLLRMSNVAASSGRPQFKSIWKLAPSAVEVERTCLMPASVASDSSTGRVTRRSTSSGVEPG